jgi:hypothetical protein
VRQRFLREGPHRGWQTLATLIRDGQEAGEFRRDLDAAAAAKLIACGLVLQIMLASLAGSKSRAVQAEFNRAFKVVEQTLVG